MLQNNQNDWKTNKQTNKQTNKAKHIYIYFSLSGFLKEALSIFKLCTPVFIFTSGSSAFLGHPRCGLLNWLSLLAIFNTLFWVYAIKNSWENGQNENENTRSTPFSYDIKMATDS